MHEVDPRGRRYFFEAQRGAGKQKSGEETRHLAGSLLGDGGAGPGPGQILLEELLEA